MEVTYADIFNSLSTPSTKVEIMLKLKKKGTRVLNQINMRLFEMEELQLVQFTDFRDGLPVWELVIKR